MQGWIKVHRKIQDNAISKSPEYFALWIHLLLLANHKKSEFIFNGIKIALESGQFVTGRKKLAEISGVQESKIERILNYLKSEQQIEQQTNNKFRLITIINWDDYQEVEQQTEQPVNNKRTTTEQQLNTNKNDNNVKNEENEKTTTGEVEKKLFKWLSQMEDVTSPDSLMEFYLNKFSFDAVEYALNNSTCTSRAKFCKLCEHYEGKVFT